MQVTLDNVGIVLQSAMQPMHNNKRVNCNENTPCNQSSACNASFDTRKLSSLVASLMVLVIGLEGHYDREPRREQFTVHYVWLECERLGLGISSLNCDVSKNEGRHARI
mmetsp:Transcript_15891/g.23600  ORF Transcript_15891/g.23600 Transcript_15891/m.23600 type:complete len:109 (+) Transcript_15891:338-664(+)